MKILIFDTDQRTREVFDAALTGHELIYTEGPVSDDVLVAHSDAEIISLFVSSSFTRERIEKMPALKCIVTRSTGFDHIDVVAAKEKGIPVCSVPKYGAHTVAEFAFALILALSRHIVGSVNSVRTRGDFNRDGMEGFDLFGKTLGVVGTGAIGRNVVMIARGFGMKVKMHDMFPNQSLVAEDAQYVPFDTLLAESDIVTLHAPYTPETHHLINAETLARMKPGSYLANTARGELVDTGALLAALEAGALAGAGLDVLEGERSLGTGAATALVDTDLKLIQHPRVIVTPHSAFYSREAYTEILTVAAQDVVACIAGTPQNAVKV